VGTADTAAVTGLVEPGYEGVRNAFADNFRAGREVGAALCVHRGGRKVVDIGGGSFDTEGTRPYGPDTLQLVFSSTKGATAACASLLAQRGQLDLGAPVADYWPEFAQAGKETLPVRFLLSHQAGVPALNRSLSAEDVQAWDPVIEALAEQVPFWEPGTAHGYHALTYGYAVGEVVRRITGRTIGTYFAEEVAGPLGLEFFIGLPADLEPRVSPVVGAPIGVAAPRGGGGYSSTLLARALNMGGAFRDPAWMNRPAWHAAEVPAGNGITNATSLSRLYAGLVGPVEGGPPDALLTPEQVEAARTVLTFGEDKVFGSVGFPLKQKIGLGFWCASPAAPWGGAGSFGHGGAGGSYGFADPEHGLAVGYVMNKMSEGVVVDPRSSGIVTAIYDAVGAPAKYV
jgi:CubicO group peptidase (beta-lactamase class C family)